MILPCLPLDANGYDREGADSGVILIENGHANSRQSRRTYTFAAARKAIQVLALEGLASVLDHSDVFTSF